MIADAATLQWEISDSPVAYDVAIAAMQSRVAAIQRAEAPELVWLLEHPALYTAGTSATPEGLVDPDRLPVHRTGRGGQWTYHGPGQRIGYVMLDLSKSHGRVQPRDVRAYVDGLEEWLIRTLLQFDIRGERRPGRVGIWVTDPATRTEAKIAALGVRVTRWVSWHGVALNVAPDLRHFEGIVPCGIREHGVTSLHALGRAVTREQADAAMQSAWAEVFESSL